MKKSMVLIALFIFLIGCGSNDSEKKTAPVDKDATLKKILIRQSGGVIVDVFKINNVQNTDINTYGYTTIDSGERFVENNKLTGDIKIVIITKSNEPIWDKYHEYHQEFEPDGMTYGKKFNSQPVK